MHEPDELTPAEYDDVVSAITANSLYDKDYTSKLLEKLGHEHMKAGLLDTINPLLKDPDDIKWALTKRDGMTAEQMNSYRLFIVERLKTLYHRG